MIPSRYRGTAIALLAAALLASNLAHGARSARSDRSARSQEPSFESQWQDGRAELAGYHYHVTRYGEARTGQAVMITVTEPFSASKRVKLDDPAKNPADAFEAVKVNLVRDFQTGIYDYNTMTSVFVRSRDFTPVKFSFSSSEWCGNVYEELLVDRNAVRQTLRSYFEGESGERSLAWKPGGVSEDQLFILLRGLRGAVLKPGEKRAVALLPGAIERRLAHHPLAWVSATIERARSAETITVPAGRFAADRYRVVTGDAREGNFWIERASPHRIVRWSWTSKRMAGPWAGEAMESAELAGSARLSYWKLHGNGQESYLKELGLQPLPTLRSGLPRRG